MRKKRKTFFTSQTNGKYHIYKAGFQYFHYIIGETNAVIKKRLIIDFFNI